MFGNNDDKGSIFDTGGSIFDNKGASGGSIFSNDKQSSESLYDRYANDSSNDLISRYSGSGPSGGPDLVSMYNNSGPDLGQDLVSKYSSGPGLGGTPGFQGSLERSEVGFLQSNEDRLFYRMEAMDMGIMNEDKYKASFMVEDGPMSGMAILNVRGQNHGNRSLIDRMRGLESNHLDLDDDSVSLVESYSDKHLDKRVMNGAYNVTLSDIYNDKRMYMANFGLFTDGIIKPASDTYTEFGQTGNDEDPFDEYSLYAEGHAKSDDYDNFFSRATQAIENDIYDQESVFSEREEGSSIFSQHEPSQNDLPAYLQTGPAYMQTKNSMFDLDKEEVDLSKMSPGEKAKYEKQLKDQAEKEEREEKKRLAKEEKARKKEQEELEKSKAYEEELRNEYKNEGEESSSIYVTSYNEKDTTSDTKHQEKGEATIFDAIYASSPISSSKKEEVDEATFSMMTPAEKAKIIKDGRAPSTLSEAEKRKLLMILESLEGALNAVEQKRESVFNFESLPEAIDASENMKNENKNAMEKAAKAMSVATFMNLPENEKLKAFEEGKTPEDLDNMTLEELKRKLADEEEKRKASGGLNEMFRKKAEEERNDNPFSNDPQQNPENMFKSLPLDEQLKLIKSGKVPEGVPPGLVAKALQQEKSELEKQKRMEAKAAAKAEKEQAKMERIAAENAAIIEKLRQTNRPKSEEDPKGWADGKDTLKLEDEAEILKGIRKMSEAEKPLDDKFNNNEITVATKIKDSNLDELDMFKDMEENEDSSFEVFGKSGSYAEKFAAEQQKLKEARRAPDIKRDNAPPKVNPEPSMEEDVAIIAEKIKKLEEKETPLDDKKLNEEARLLLDDDLVDATMSSQTPNIDNLAYLFPEKFREEKGKKKKKKKKKNDIPDSTPKIDLENAPKALTVEDLRNMLG